MLKSGQAEMKEGRFYAAAWSTRHMVLYIHSASQGITLILSLTYPPWKRSQIHTRVVARRRPAELMEPPAPAKKCLSPSLWTAQLFWWEKAGLKLSTRSFEKSSYRLLNRNRRRPPAWDKNETLSSVFWKVPSSTTCTLNRQWKGHFEIKF